MTKRLSIFAMFLLLFSFISPLFPATKAESASVNPKLSLGENITGWTIDPTNKMIYTVTGAGNLDFISYNSSMQVAKTIALPGSASDIKQVGNSLFIAIPSAQKIVEVDLTSKTVSKTISTAHIPYRIAVGTNKIYYVPQDQWCYLYEYDLNTSTEKEITIQGDTYTSLYEPSLAIDRATQTLYVGESGTTGATIKAVSTVDYSLKSQSTYDDSNGFSSPKRHMLLDGNSVFYAGRELNASNLADIKGTYMSGESWDSDIIGVSSNDVYTENGVYDRNSYLKLGNTPSTLKFELNDGNEMFYVGTDGQTIYSETYQPPKDSFVQPATLNHKLVAEHKLTDWVLDEANHNIYAISQEGNKLLKIDTQTMSIVNQVNIGSEPSDIKLSNGKLYIALSGSTKVVIVDPGTLNTLAVQTTLQNPYKITTNGTDLYYVTKDQWSYIYHLNLSTGADQKIVVPNTNTDTYSEPDIALDPATNELYVGESDSTGSNLYVVDPSNGSRIQTNTNSGNGFYLPARKIMLNGNSVYYAGAQFSKTDVTNETTKYFDPSSDKILTVNGTDVFAESNIYDKSTFSSKYKFQKHSEGLAAENSQGEIFTYVPDMGALYKFPSIDKLVNQKVGNLAGSFNNSGDYSLNWDEGTGDFYSVEVNQKNVASPKQHDFTFSDNQLKSFYGFTETFGVKNNFADVQSAASTFQHYFTIPVPTGLAVKKSSNSDDVKLSWNPVRLMDGYNVYAYTSDATDKTLINESPVQGNAFTIPLDKRLEWAGKTVHFVVTSFVNNKESKISSSVNYTFPVPVPTDLTAKKAEDSNDVVIGWKAIDHMDGYTVSAYTNDPSVKTILNSDPVKENQFTLPVNEQKDWIGKTVHFVVSTWANGKESADSKPVDFTFKMPTPTEVKVAKAEDNSDVIVGWKKIDFMDGYDVYAYTDDPTAKTLLNDQPIQGDSFAIPYDMQKQWLGQKVHFVVAGLLNGKESADSDPADYTFKIQVPSNFHITIEKNWDTVMSWDAVKGADGYNVYYYTVANPSKKVLINTKPITKNTYTVPESAWPKWQTKFNYFVAVSAIYGKKESPLSQPVELTWIPDSTSSKSDNNQKSSDQKGSSSDQSSGTTSDNKNSKTSNNGSNTQTGTNSQTTSGTTNNQQSSAGQIKTSQSSNIVQTSTSDQSSTPNTNDSTKTTSTGTSGSSFEVTTTVTNTTVTISNGSIQDLKDGDTASVNLSSEQKDVTNVVFTPEQMDKLISQNNPISIERDTTTLVLPSSIFNISKSKTTVSVVKLDHVDGSIGDVYDYTIHQGSNVVSHFDNPVTLSFNVDPSKVTNPQALKVYYWNTESKKWELIGGSYKDGVVTAQTIHFSTYGVFEKQNVKKAAAPNLKKLSSQTASKQQSKSSSQAASKQLSKSSSQPNKGSMGIWITLIVLFVIACGFSAFVIIRRRA